MPLSIAEERVAPSGQDRKDSLADGPSNTSIEVRDDGRSIVVSRGGAWLCRARARVERLPARNLGLGGQLLILDEFAASQPSVLDSDSKGALPVLRDLLRSAKTNTRRPWHVLRVDARSDQNAVVGAAWRFALEWDMACEIAWGADDIVSVYAYQHAARSAMARFLQQTTRIRKAGASLSRRIATVRRLLAPRRSAAALLLGLDLNTVALGTGVTGVTFRSVDLATVSRRPLLYGDTVFGTEDPLQRGEECFIGELEGRTVFRMWVGTVKPQWLAGVDELTAGKRARYLHESHTIAEFRNRGIRTAALQWLAPLLLDHGYEMLWLHVMPDNAPAIRSAEKVGFRRVAT
jgi:GNAT superfamily N-acetyltransferase